MTLVLLTVAANVSASELPSIVAVRSVVKKHFAGLKDYKPNDIISKRDVTPILKSLAKQGWKISDEKQLMDEVLDDGHALVQIFRTKQGKKFMREISGDKNVYDRLDRIVREKDGAALLRKIIALPDGKKYTRAHSGPGQPTLSDLLLISERGSAHDRKLKDFDKPTGMQYTADAFWTRLQVSYKRDLRKARGS
jgi:hypothetical protein